MLSNIFSGLFYIIAMIFCFLSYFFPDKRSEAIVIILCCGIGCIYWKLDAIHKSIKELKKDEVEQ